MRKRLAAPKQAKHFLHSRTLPDTMYACILYAHGLNCPERDCGASCQVKKKSKAIKAMTSRHVASPQQVHQDPLGVHLGSAGRSGHRSQRSSDMHARRESLRLQNVVPYDDGVNDGLWMHEVVCAGVS